MKQKKNIQAVPGIDSEEDESVDEEEDEKKEGDSDEQRDSDKVEKEEQKKEESSSEVDQDSEQSEEEEKFTEIVDDEEADLLEKLSSDSGISDGIPKEKVSTDVENVITIKDRVFVCIGK